MTRILFIITFLLFSSTFLFGQDSQDNIYVSGDAIVYNSLTTSNSPKKSTFEKDNQSPKKLKFKKNLAKKELKRSFPNYNKNEIKQSESTENFTLTKFDGSKAVHFRTNQDNKIHKKDYSNLIISKNYRDRKIVFYKYNFQYLVEIYYTFFSRPPPAFFSQNFKYSI